MCQQCEWWQTFEQQDIFLNPDDHADRSTRTPPVVSKFHHPKRQNMAAVTELERILHYHPRHPSRRTAAVTQLSPSGTKKAGRLQLES